MAGIGTKDVKVGGGSLPKSFAPGNHTCKINEIRLDRPPFAKPGEDMYSIVMDLETQPIENFEGFLIDKNDESKGRYLGQTGRVKSGKWPYKNSEWNGKKFNMVDEIVKFIKSICIEIDSDWCDKVDGKYGTIEEFVEAFNNDAPFKDIFLDWCIGGQQTTNDQGYPQYYMYLPKWQRGEKLFALPGDINVMPFDKTLHVDVKDGELKTVNSFESNETSDDDDPFAVTNTDDDDPFAVDASNDDDDPFAVS
jgi:hypothetical protein